MTIVEFIAARVAEDEARATAAQEWTNRTPWRYMPSPYGGDAPGSIEDERIEHPLTSENVIAESVGEDAWGEHIAAEGPIAALRRCAGVRRAVDAEIGNLQDIDADHGDGCEWEEIRAGQCPGSHEGFRYGDIERSGVLRGLASFWSHHPDYRKEWA